MQNDPFYLLKCDEATVVPMTGIAAPGKSSTALFAGQKSSSSPDSCSVNSPMNSKVVRVSGTAIFDLQSRASLSCC